jgi:tetratricopeptide (TPR) repeat protein
MNSKSTIGFITTIATVLTATVYLLFPVFFLTITTDFFTFPKQILVVFASIILLILWGVKALAERKVTVLMNPLNIPVVLFAVVLILSTFFSLSRQDALLQSLPVILLCLFFFTTINFVQEKSSFMIIIISLLIGTSVSALLSILAYFNIFVLPFEAVKNQGFNTHGSPIQYIAFLLPLLVLCGSSLLDIVKKKKISAVTKYYTHIIQLVSALIFVVASVLVIYQIVISAQKPILLPFNHGFQVAFAAISQDSQRMAQSLLVGSGYGTFSADFTRFIGPAFNSYSFWNLTFAFSSSYVLELLATTGILGLIAFAFIFVNFIRSKARATNPLFLATLTAFILSLVIPFSFSMVFLLFALLSLFVAHRAIENARGFDHVTLNLVTLRQGLFSVSEGSGKSKENLIVPTIILALSVLSAVYILFYLTGSGSTPRKGYVALISSDIKFAKSFTPEALKNGTETYNLQTQAITEYPYRSDYYRLFSQINLALAANLVNAQQGKQPTEEVQNNIILLLQQSINSARQAVTLSAFNSLNWQNLGQIYRNLIGVGQNAEQFAVASYNQSIALNPSNPGLRIELGGIYYQLKQWDLAQNQFTIATQLKPDYANAYYNLGHVMEEKGDLANALPQYQAVRQLVANDKANADKIDVEIKALQAKIGAAQQQANDKAIQPTADNTPLNVNKPQTEFPPKDPRVTIPEPPKGQPTPTPTSIPAPTDIPTGNQN